MNPSILDRLPLGFRVLTDAAKLIWHSKILRRLAAAEVLVNVAWIATILMFLEGMSHGRLVALGSNVPLAVHIVVTVVGVLFAAYGIPGIGGIAWTIRTRTVEHTRWLLSGGARESSPPTRSMLDWVRAILIEGLLMYRRAFLMGFTMLAVASIAAALIPGKTSVLQGVVQAIAVLTLIALDTMLNSEHRAATRIQFIRARWGDIAGYVIGSWLFTLLGLVPLVVNLLAVAGELFHRRVNSLPAWPAKARFDQESKREAPACASSSSHVHPDIENYTRKVHSKVLYKLKWDARLPTGMRFVYFPLYGAREGDSIDGVLLLVGKDGRGDPNAATEFWFSRGDYVGDFWVGKPPLNGDQLTRSGDVFAGPFPLPNRR